MANLVIGPMLRYVRDSEATVWVETDGPCRIEVLGHRSDTFQVNARHYAIVAISGLAWPPGLEVEVDRRCCLSRVANGHKRFVLWLVLIIALIAVIGLGFLLKAAFVTLLVIAAVVIVLGLAIGRVVGR